MYMKIRNKVRLPSVFAGGGGGDAPFSTCTRVCIHKVMQVEFANLYMCTMIYNMYPFHTQACNRV